MIENATLPGDTVRRAAAALLVLLGGLCATRPAAAQRAADLQAVEFDTPAAPRAERPPALRRPLGPARAEVEAGDLRLMFLGGTAGAVVGYLVGWGTTRGVASVLDTENIPVAPLAPYLDALPALTSAVGAAVGAGRTSCIKLLFGSLYRLNSCADLRLSLLGALPGAALQYFLGERSAELTAASLLAEAAGATLLGNLARERRGTHPVW